LSTADKVKCANVTNNTNVQSAPMTD